MIDLIKLIPNLLQINIFQLYHILKDTNLITRTSESWLYKWARERREAINLFR